MIEKLKNSITMKLILIVVGTVTLISLLSTFYFNRIYSENLHRNLRNTVTNTEKYIRLSYINPLWNLDWAAVEKLNEAILHQEIFVAINIYDESSFVKGLQKIEGTQSEYRKLKKPYGNSGENGFIRKSIGKIKYKNEMIGRFEIFYSKKILNGLILESYFRSGLTFLIITMTIIVIIVFGIRKLAIEPVFSLVKISQQVASSNDYALRIEKTSNDEIGILFDGFNSMLEQIHARSREREKFEDELQHAKNFLSNVINSMSSILLSIDADGTITQWNDAAEEVTGLAYTEVVGKNLWEIAPRLTKYRNDCFEVIRTSTPMVFQRQTFLDMEKKYYIVSLYPLIENGARGIVLRIDDVTEMEIKDNELRQAQKMETVGTLAGGLAHDFNNVLGGITGTLSIVRHKIKRNNDISMKDLESYLGLMQDLSLRAASMVKQLLSLSRKQELSFAPVNLYNTMTRVQEICKNSFDKSIELRFKLPGNEYMIHAEETQIEQVILNICINASHAMTIMRKREETQGGVLSTEIEKIEADRHFIATHPEAEEKREYWKVSIRDTGIGMDTTTAAKVFDPFFTTKDKGKGSGLGLSMVYNIVNQHGGFIDLYSEVGVGTTFNVYLPILHRHEFVEKKKEEEHIPTGEGLILVVDDEMPMRKVAKDILEECGYEVIVAEDGEEGVKIFRERHEDISAILLDMAMPKKSGKDAYLEMQRIDNDLRVLLASGFKQDERVQAVLDLGVQQFIQKPYTLENLANAINNLLNQ